jgi:P4 family phage/plasmid primase-like protien
MTQPTTLTEFLKEKLTKSKKENHLITHTRIGCKVNNIYAGAYICEKENEDQLYSFIYKEVIQGNRMEYLTEKQLKNNVIYIDLDFRYAFDIQTHQHDNDWIAELLAVYMETIQRLMIVPEGTIIPTYVLQKDSVNRLTDGSATKDGIHIIIGLKMFNKLQLTLREKVMNNAETKCLLEMLPLTNDCEGVFDKGLSSGTTNAQVYGCRKPAHDAYKLSKIYDWTFDSCGQWKMAERPFGEITKELFLELSVRKGNRVELEMTPWSQESVIPVETLRKMNGETKPDFENGSDLEILVMKCIKGERCATGRYEDAYKLRQAIKNSVGETGRELYQRYTEKAYQDGKGSFNKYMEWEKDWDSITAGGTLSIGSIHYWAKEDNPNEYLVNFKKHHNEIKKNKSEELRETCMFGSTDVSLARYFNELFGEHFKCIDVKNRLFYEFTKEALWKKDEGGTPLRNLMSNEMKDNFLERQRELTEAATLLEPADEEHEKIQRKIKHSAEIVMKLEKTNDKNNMLREICDIIKESDFEKTMNKETYMLPLKNKKIFNVKTLEVSERTILNKFNYECDTNYRELTEAEDTEIKQYFSDLFCGKEDTAQVVLDIIKSSMTGLTLRYIYFIAGSGRNGKSVLFNILSSIFKKGMDVISKDIVLQKKSNTHLNTEVEKLDRCRIGYTTELKEEDKMNEAMLKSISGGDPINVRGICKTDETLVPTANLFVLTNELPKFDVEQAICDRLIIIPFLNTFAVDKDFERKMLEKKELVFCYIMKHGNITDKFQLTEEMKVAKQEYIDSNSENYLKDFIDIECQPASGASIERDSFRTYYNEYCKSRPIPIVDKSTNTKFTKNMKLYGFESKKSGGHTKYMGLEWKIPKAKLSEYNLDEP